MQEQTAIVLTGAARASSDACISLLSSQKFRGEVDRLGPTGTNALHIATWRNHLALTQALLASGADPNIADKESGWTPLHRAFHFGNLRIAATLLASNADVLASDWRVRNPIDLLSWDLKEYIPDSGPGEVFSWGAGTNYALGTGSAEAQTAPARVDALHGKQVVLVSAAKFHSAAVTEDGQLYTWGFGRGGRLGHPDAHLVTGESAVIAPRLVASLGRRSVTAIAAAKHHTILCTSAGEVWSMGSNRYGQLGIPGIDTQPEPRRVSPLKVRVVTIAAANKHSVAVTAGGEVYCWGCNSLGQLGYGTFESATSSTPRCVEALKGRIVIAVAAAKRHTLVLTDDHDVFTWGHRGVSPRRVLLAGTRDAVGTDGKQLRFHRGHGAVVRPEAAAITAGAAHSSVLTTTGVVLCWRSADPEIHVQEVGGPLAGKKIVAISAGKYRTAAVTEAGDVYSWEGRSDFFPAEGRRSGSGSKKTMGGSATKSGGRPIPTSMTMAGSLGSDPGIHRLHSYQAAESWGSYSSYGNSPSGGSYQRSGPSSFFERVYSMKQKGSPGAGFHAGSLTHGRPETPRSAARASMHAMDTFKPILPVRLLGLKKAALVAVGEKHSLALQRWSVAQFDTLESLPSWVGQNERISTDGDDESDNEATQQPVSTPASTSASPLKAFEVENSKAPVLGPASLQQLAEEAVARTLVDPRTVLQVLEYADAAGADILRSYCLAVAVCNLDAVLIEARGAFEELPEHLLGELEMLYKTRYTRSGICPVKRALDVGEYAKPRFWLQAGLRPSMAAPCTGDATLSLQSTDEAYKVPTSATARVPMRAESSFKDLKVVQEEESAFKLRRALGKKLQQIALLEVKAASGASLDHQQRNKVAQRPILLSALAALDGGMAPDEVQTMLQAAMAAAEDHDSSSLDTAVTPGVGLEYSNKMGSGSGASEGSSRIKSKTRARRSRLLSEKSVLAHEASCTTIPGTSPHTNFDVPPFPDLQTVPPTGASSPLSNTCAAAGSTKTKVPAISSRPSSAEPTKTVGFTASPVSKTRATTRAKPAAPPRKGGLSMFLRGELDDCKPTTSSPNDDSQADRKSAAPWGGKSMAALAPIATSIKDILASEESATCVVSTTPLAPKTRTPVARAGKPPSTASSAKRIPLSAFLETQAPRAEKSPAWGGVSGASPPSSYQPSLRRIQEEQELVRRSATQTWGMSPPSSSGILPHRPPLPGVAQSSFQTASFAGRPATSPPGGTGAATTVVLGSSPSRRVFLASPPPQSKWYVPEEQEYRPKKSIALIQQEEAALQEVERINAAIAAAEERETSVKEKEDSRKKRKNRYRKKGAPKQAPGDGDGGSTRGENAPKKEQQRKPRMRKGKSGEQDKMNNQAGTQVKARVAS